MPAYIALVPQDALARGALGAECDSALALLEVIEQRAAREDVEVDSRIVRGRTTRQAIAELMDEEQFDALVIPARSRASDGLDPADVAWVLETAPSEVLVLRPEPALQRTPPDRGESSPAERAPRPQGARRPTTLAGGIGAVVSGLPPVEGQGSADDPASRSWVPVGDGHGSDDRGRGGNRGRVRRPGDGGDVLRAVLQRGRGEPRSRAVRALRQRVGVHACGRMRQRQWAPSEPQRRHTGDRGRPRSLSRRAPRWAHRAVDRLPGARRARRRVLPTGRRHDRGRWRRDRQWRPEARRLLQGLQGDRRPAPVRHPAHLSDGQERLRPGPELPAVGGAQDVTYSLTDPTAPAVSVTGGTLLEGAVQTGRRRSPSTPATRARECDAWSWRSTESPPARRAATAGSTATSPCRSVPVRRRSRARSSSTRPRSRGATGATRSASCVEDASAGSQSCTQRSRVLALNGCATNAAAAANDDARLARQARRRPLAPGPSAHGRGEPVQRRPDAVSRGSVCFSRGIPTDRTGAERVLDGAAVTGADGTAGVKVRGQSSRFVRATYFAGPEQVITKRIRLDVSPGDPPGDSQDGQGREGRHRQGRGRAAGQVQGQPADLLLRVAARPRQVRLRRDRHRGPGAGWLSRPRRPASFGSTPRCPTSARTRTAAGAR